MPHALDAAIHFPPHCLHVCLVPIAILPAISIAAAILKSPVPSDVVNKSATMLGKDRTCCSLSYGERGENLGFVSLCGFRETWISRRQCGWTDILLGGGAASALRIWNREVCYVVDGGGGSDLVNLGSRDQFLGFEYKRNMESQKKRNFNYRCWVPRTNWWDQKLWYWLGTVQRIKQCK